jgi:hypothetical protein
MTTGGAEGVEGTSGVAFPRSDLRRGMTELAVNKGGGGFVCCRGTVAGTVGAEMSVDWMTRSRKGEQK